MMTLSEIRTQIETTMDDAAHSEWAGLTNQDKNDYIVDIQRGFTSVESVCEKLSSDAAFSVSE